MAHASVSRIDHDLDAQSPAADLVRVYLNGIGKTALLNAADEVDWPNASRPGCTAAPAGYTQAPQREPETRSCDRRPRRRSRAPAPAGSEPAFGGVAGQALHRARYAAAGPHPGGQPGPDPRYGEVRLRQGFQVLHVCHLVDSSSDHSRDGRSEPHHQAAGHLVEQVNKLARIKREMHQTMGREASDEELAAESGIPVEKINDLLEHSRDPVSLDMPVGSDEEAPLGDFIEDAEAMSAESSVISGLLHTDIRSVLATLDEREQQVIRLRFGLDDGQPRTLDQIGKLFGLSRERVRQIEREVMSKLRNGERADRLRSYAS